MLQFKGQIHLAVVLKHTNLDHLIQLLNLKEVGVTGVPFWNEFQIGNNFQLWMTAIHSKPVSNSAELEFLRVYRSVSTSPTLFDSFYQIQNRKTSRFGQKLFKLHRKFFLRTGDQKELLMTKSAIVHFIVEKYVILFLNKICLRR